MAKNCRDPKIPKLRALIADLLIGINVFQDDKGSIRVMMEKKYTGEMS